MAMTALPDFQSMYLTTHVLGLISFDPGLLVFFFFFLVVQHLLDT